MNKSLKLLAIIVIGASSAYCTTTTRIISFDENGIDYRLPECDVVLMPKAGIETLMVTANHDGHNHKVTVAEQVKKIYFKGSGTYFQNMDILNKKIITEFADAADGEEYVNTIPFGQRLECGSFTVEKNNTIHVLGTLDTSNGAAKIYGTVITGK